jgi:hypothetical protein
MKARKLVLSCCLIAVVALSLGNGCPPTVPLTGDALAGQTLYNQMCASCHPFPSLLKPSADNIVNNLGTINPAMAGITLTNQQIAQLQAFLATQ